MSSKYERYCKKNRRAREEHIREVRQLPTLQQILEDGLCTLMVKTSDGSLHYYYCSDDSSVPLRCHCGDSFEIPALGYGERLSHRVLLRTKEQRKAQQQLRQTLLRYEEKIKKMAAERRKVAAQVDKIVQLLVSATTVDYND